MRYLMGIDLGGSSVKALVLAPDGQRLAEYVHAFDADRELGFAAAVRKVVARAGRELGGDAERIGLSAPGLAADDGRSIAFLPGRLAGLENLNWGDYLGRPEGVAVLNDAHAALLGEVWQGAAKGASNVILMTLGTGVGGAAMVDGRLLRGAIGRAGHFGHLCLDPEGPPDICRTPGSLEYHIGNYSLAARGEGRFENTHALIEAYNAGDAFAARAWRRSVRALACGIASLVNILDPEIAVVGGGIAKAGAALFDPLAEELDRVEWRPGGFSVRVMPAVLGEFAGAYGAARNVAEVG